MFFGMGCENIALLVFMCLLFMAELYQHTAAPHPRRSVCGRLLYHVLCDEFWHGRSHLQFAAHQAVCGRLLYHVLCDEFWHGRSHLQFAAHQAGEQHVALAR
jgi:hypothetical protein